VQVLTALSALPKPTLIVTGRLLLIGTVLNSFAVPSEFSAAARTAVFELSSAILLISSMLLVLVLIALHARQVDPVGRFGLVAGVPALAGTMLLAGTGWSETFLDQAACSDRSTRGRTPPSRAFLAGSRQARGALGRPTRTNLHALKGTPPGSPPVS